jgi:hypothetical protein
VRPPKKISREPFSNHGFKQGFVLKSVRCKSLPSLADAGREKSITAPVLYHPRTRTITYHKTREFERIMKELTDLGGLGIVDQHRDELKGIQRLEARGSVYFLIGSPLTLHKSKA